MIFVIWRGLGLVNGWTEAYGWSQVYLASSFWASNHRLWPFHLPLNLLMNGVYQSAVLLASFSLSMTSSVAIFNYSNRWGKPERTWLQCKMRVYVCLCVAVAMYQKFELNRYGCVYMHSKSLFTLKTLVSEWWMNCACRRMLDLICCITIVSACLGSPPTMFYHR